MNQGPIKIIQCYDCHAIVRWYDDLTPRGWFQHLEGCPNAHVANPQDKEEKDADARYLKALIGMWQPQGKHWVKQEINTDLYPLPEED